MVNTIPTTYEGSPRNIRRWMLRSIMARKVPFVQSSPGMGKSALTRSIADEYGLHVIDHRLSTSAPEDLTGLAKFEKRYYETIDPLNGSKINNEYEIAKFVPFETFPIKGTPIPKGKNGWLLFLDEFNSANKTVQAAAYKLILDRQIGMYDLHPDVHIICAGNLATDRAIVNSLSTAMQSRLIHLIMKLDNDEFIEDVVMKMGWDNRILAYLSYDKNKIFDFKPDHNDKTFCCPRTWEFMHDLIVNEPELKEEDTGLYAGTITSGTATEFMQFTKVFLNLPKIEDILRNPDGLVIPSDRQLQFAIITYLHAQVNDNTLDAIGKYVARFASEFRIVFFRRLQMFHPELRYHPAFAKGVVDISRYLHD